MNGDWAELVKIPSRVIDNASSREAPRDLDKNSFESKAKNFAFIKVSQVAGFLI